MPTNHPDDSAQPTPKWNDDPAWIAYIARLEGVITAICVKFSPDEDMQQDCAQEARMALLTKRPEDVRGYEDYLAGRIGEAEWHARLDRYLRTVIRNRILKYLDSFTTGDWYIGRTRRKIDAKTGRRRRIVLPPRYSSVDQLSAEFGLQIDDQGMAVWTESKVYRDRTDTADE